MATIKQIAEKTGYSLSTVSIVLRGSSAERGIPESTQKKIFDAARELDYQPNISARRLRSDEPLKRSVAVFWAFDFRASLVAQFLKGAQRFILENALDAEIVVRPYQPDRLAEVATQTTLNMYSGAIVCTASQTDLTHIEGVSTTCPIVLYNRNLEKYTCVGVDNAAVGRKAAIKLLDNGCRHALAIADHAELDYTKARLRGFLEMMARAGVPAQIMKVQENTVAQGIACAKGLQMIHEHTGIFTCSDNIALGLLRRLIDEGRRVPEEIEVISVGTSDPDLYNCLRPGLSVIEIPIEEMAYRCVGALKELWVNRSLKVANIVVPFAYRPGRSTR